MYHKQTQILQNRKRYDTEHKRPKRKNKKDFYTILWVSP
jgi:hypothetical protein